MADLGKAKFAIKRVADATFEQLKAPANYEVMDIIITESNPDADIVLVKMGECWFALVFNIENDLAEAVEVMLG